MLDTQSPDVSFPSKIKRISITINMIIIVISLIALLGWLTGNLALASWYTTYKPMSINTLILFIFLSVSMLTLSWRPREKSHKIILPILASAVICYSVLIIIFHDLRVSSNLSPQAAFEHWMAPLAAIGFIISGLTLLLYFLPKRKRASFLLFDISTLGIFILGAISTIGYIYKMPLMYGGAVVPISLPASILFILIALVFMINDPNRSPVYHLFFSSSIQSRIFRVFLPSILLLMILTGWFFTITRNTVDKTASNPVIISSVMTIVVLAVTALLITIISKWVGKDLEKSEQNLKQAYLKLQAFWDIALVEEASTKEICDHILRSIVKMTESKYGFFGFINEDESVMTIHSWSGEAMKGCSMVNKPSQFLINEAGVWGEAIRQRKFLILNDYTELHHGKKGLPAGHVPLTRLMVIPIFTHDRIVSVAAVANKTSNYEESDVKQLSAFAESMQMLLDQKRQETLLKES